MQKQGLFHCKQFTLADDNCAMKVGTDSMILGAWTPLSSAERYILDIGSGCGILTLMMAQRSHPDCRIVGVEIESKAAQQGMDNIRASIFDHKACVIEQDINHMQFSRGFDLILSNPPYFQAPSAVVQHKQNISPRERARLQFSLNNHSLIDCARFLNDTGQMFIIVPTENQDKLIDFAKEKGLHLHRRLKIINNERFKEIRVILGFAKQPSAYQEARLEIFDEHNQYTDQYRQLCKDFYLKF